MSIHSAPPTSCQIDHDTLAMLLHAAALFAQKGFHETRTKDLDCEQFSETAFFNKFRTKNGILQGLFEFMWGEMLARANKCTAGIDDPIKRLCEYMRVYISIFRDFEHVCRVVTMTTYPKTKGPSESAKRHDLFQKMVLRTLADADKKELLCEPRVPVSIIYHALRGSIQALLNQYYIERYFGAKKTTSFEIKEIEESICAIVSGFLRTPRSTLVEQFALELSGLRDLLNLAEQRCSAFSELGGKLGRLLECSGSHDSEER